jgi:hypothetical protein
VGALAVGAALMLGTAGVTAAHPSRPASGAVAHVYETGTGGPADADVLTGAVGDRGVDHLGVLDHGNVNKIRARVVLTGWRMRGGLVPAGVTRGHRAAVGVARQSWAGG